jgi:hypothetical protein
MAQGSAPTARVVRVLEALRIHAGDGRRYAELAQDAGLVEEDGGERHGDHAEGIGRGEHAGHGRDGDDGIAAKAAQTLRRDHAGLRQQAQHAAVRSRKHTGVGFWTYFAVEPGAPRLANSGRLRLSDVGAVVQDVQHGAGFILWVEHGVIDCLEGFTYADDWPKEPKLIRWHYLGHTSPGNPMLVETDVRNLEDVFNRKG